MFLSPSKLYSWRPPPPPKVVKAEDDQDEIDAGLGHMTDKPLKNGRKYVDSKFVHDRMDNKTDQHYFLRGHIWPSMRNDLPHNVLIVLSVTSGAVIHASCQPCKVAVQGRCSHVVVVLFSLLDHVQEHGAVLTKPSTSQECTWNKGKKKEIKTQNSCQALAIHQNEERTPWLLQILTPDLLDIDRLIQNTLTVFLEICKEYLPTAPKVQCEKHNSR